MNMSEGKKTAKFSVALGLFDYINPVFYTVTSLMILFHAGKALGLSTPGLAVYALGAFVSLLFGFTIPTVKLMVGLGKMKFKMPVNLVFYVNTGILVSGLVLIKAVMKMSVPRFLILIAAVICVLLLVLLKTKKPNSAAVLTGAFGYMMIYVSLISHALSKGITVCAVLYAAAICLFMFLCMVGMRWNLKDARVHWVIEICNVICQGAVALSTVLLFH